MIMAEFSGWRAGYFRPKPVSKCGMTCPRCGNGGHIGKTTCEVKAITPEILAQLKAFRVVATPRVLVRGGVPSSRSDSSLSLPDRMEAEAEKFGKCRDLHDALGNVSSSAVAERARQRLSEYAAELKVNAKMYGERKRSNTRTKLGGKP